MKNKFLLIMVFFLFPCTVYSWDGYDWDKNAYIEIDQGNLVRTGNDIEIYDYGSREYKNVEIQNINNYGSSVELEVYDYSTGEYRTFEMDN